MKIVFRVLGMVILAGLGVWLWTILFPSPQKIIRQRLEAIAKCVSFAPGEGQLVGLAGAEGLAGYFATNVEINLEVPGRDQLHHHRSQRNHPGRLGRPLRRRQPEGEVSRYHGDRRPEPAIRHGRSDRGCKRLRSTGCHRAGNENPFAENQRRMAHYPRRNRPHAFHFGL